MDMIAIYRNFWTRNLVIVIVCLLIIFACVYDVDPEVNETKEQFYWVFAKISRGFVPLYIAMIFSNTVLVRQLFFQKKYVFFIISFLVFWSSYHILIQYYYDWAQLGKPTSLAIQLGKVSLLLSVVAISNGTAMYFLHLWILRNIAESQKEIMTIESELTFLKQQLNPHFLLNVMNNLYGESLALPESVPDRILNVSDLLRYQIEATKRDVVPLEEEIENVILIQSADDDDPDRNKEKPLFKEIRRTGKIENNYAREAGTSVYLLLGAKTSINEILKKDIAENTWH